MRYRNRALWTALFSGGNPVIAYHNAAQNILQPDVYLIAEPNQGDEFQDLISGDQDIGTNTAFAGLTDATDGVPNMPKIATDGSTSLVDMASRIPNASANFGFLCRVEFDDITPLSNRYLLRMSYDTGDDYFFILLTSGTLRLIRNQGADTITRDNDISSLTGLNTLGFFEDGTNVHVVVNDTIISQDLLSGTMSGSSLSPGVIASISTSPGNVINGDWVFASFNLTNQLNATKIANLYDLLGIS